LVHVTYVLAIFDHFGHDSVYGGVILWLLPFIGVTDLGEAAVLAGILILFRMIIGSMGAQIITVFFVGIAYFAFNIQGWNLVFVIVVLFVVVSATFK
jgi:hypothetical protein